MLDIRDMTFRDAVCDCDQVDNSGTALKGVCSSYDMSRANCLRYAMLQQAIDAVIYATVKIRLHCILLCCVSKQYCHSVLAWAQIGE